MKTHICTYKIGLAYAIYDSAKSLEKCNLIDIDNV